MGTLKLLEEAKEAFQNMDWERLAKITREIADKKPDEQIENLANGFYYYAQAKLEKEQKKVILDLEKAGNFFKGIDAHLAGLADIERLILLSEFDKKNRGLHLRDLGELTQGLFLRTGDSANLHLAIESFNRARDHFSGKELAQIILDLQFCHGSHAQHCENPAEQYTEVIKLTGEVKTKDKTILACSKMNVAIAHHNLAFLKNEHESIKKAIKLNEEAVEIFEQLNSKPEIVRAKQSLANVLMDASSIDTANTEKCMKRAIAIKKEVAELFLQDGFDIDSGYEALNIGVACIEFAACDQNCSDDHLKDAIKHFSAAAEIFEKEEVDEGLANAKAGIAAVYRNQGSLEKAAEMYEEAIAIFEEPLSQGRTKQNLAETYRDMAETTGEKSHLKKAEKLEKEAEELLKSTA